MAGIYVHIPYCKKKCSYCNFFIAVSLKTKDAFLEALLKEIELGHDYLEEKSLASVYFGGGTPSLLKAREIYSILNAINKHFELDDDAEITLEANPDDINKEFLRELQDIGINRLSVGIQSFFDDELALLGRTHDSATAIRAIHDIKDAGFDNANMDLIFGIPGSTMDRWKRNLDIFLDKNIEHLSCYNLTVEPRTELRYNIKKGKIQALRDDFGAEAFMYAHNILASQGYEHYEISNYARNEKYALHNTNYWLGAKYWGLGPSAHSYNGKQRQWNVANVRKYINALKDGIIPAQIENLSLADRYNEYVLTRLRTMWGVDAKEIKAMGMKYLIHFEKEIEKFLRQNLVQKHGDIYSLTPAGMLFADKITASLFI